MLKTFSIVSFALLSLILSGASLPSNPKRLTKTQIIARKIEISVEPARVLEYLRKCNVKILNGQKTGRPLSTIEYSSCSSQLDVWLKYRWFIADTGFSRKWLKKVQDLIIYMRQMQNIIDTAKRNRGTNTPKYAQALKYYDVAYERFVETIKKPVKVSSKVQRRAKLNKALWQKSMRKKYKIDKKSEPDFL